MSMCIVNELPGGVEIVNVDRSGMRIRQLTGRDWIQRQFLIIIAHHFLNLVTQL